MSQIKLIKATNSTTVYVDNVIGYTAYNLDGNEGNHSTSFSDFIRVIAKRVYIDGKAIEITKRVIDENCDDFTDRKTKWQIEFHDDIVNVRNPEIRSVKWDIDEFSDEMSLYNLAYAKCLDIRIGSTCCFDGIIVNYEYDKYEYDEYDYYPTQTTITYRLLMADQWIAALYTQSRIDRLWTCVEQKNCCS
uniref:Uncharacterized protein n=1 Tax=Marseillevirus LCMAC102 TaxID=2506603 RepID=A0A481YUQ1_9VIRU|nr:MAG: hypothetical protein LCMAC102_04060 [Marseillevirus LCMAC102]